jgi:hypothetical protein
MKAALAGIVAAIVIGVIGAAVLAQIDVSSRDTYAIASSVRL